MQPARVRRRLDDQQSLVWGESLWTGVGPLLSELYFYVHPA